MQLLDLRFIKLGGRPFAAPDKDISLSLQERIRPLMNHGGEDTISARKFRHSTFAVQGHKRHASLERGVMVLACSISVSLEISKRHLVAQGSGKTPGNSSTRKAQKLRASMDAKGAWPGLRVC